jgi:hypothetical protein
MDHDLLIIPAKPDVERDAVAAAWKAAGGDVLRLDRFWQRPDVSAERVALYGADTFCLVVAQVLGVHLVSPPDDVLLQADPEVTKRTVRGVALGEALGGPFPMFVKPLVPKVFRAAVWRTPDDLRAECKGLAPDTPVLTSEIVSVAAEGRAWVLDGQVLSCAIYEGDADPSQAAGFLERAARILPLPETCVLDAALVENRGWCLLEANAAWGAGLNGCDPAAAVRCIDRATRRGSTTGGAG